MVKSIVRIERKTANNFYKAYEHLGNVGLGVWHFGMLLNDELVATASYGVPCFSSHRGFLSDISRKHDLKIIQLCRGATKQTTYQNLPSQMVTGSFKLIREKFGDCLVVAYSDTKFNEMGTIYQACNALYLGKTNPAGQANYIINGVFKSGWNVRKTYGTRDMKKLTSMNLDVKKLQLNPKHRYAFILAPKIKKRIITNNLISHICPYPKRSVLGLGSMKEYNLNNSTSS